MRNIQVTNENIRNRSREISITMSVVGMHKTWPHEGILARAACPISNLQQRIPTYVIARRLPGHLQLPQPVLCCPN
jgi:hypothetical protein